MSSSNSDLIQIRLKLKDGKVVGGELEGTTKKVKKLGDTTARTSTKQAKAQKVTSRLTAAYKSLGTTAKWGLGILGVGGVLALQTSIHNTEELSKTTTGLVRNLDFQTNVASRWGAVAQAREIDTKALNMSFGTLSSRMVEAGRKGGTLLTPFHQLGLTQEEVRKGADDFQWGLLRVAEALGEEEGGAKRSTAAKALLGKGYQSLLPLFSEGTVGLKEQLHWADEYGVTLSGHTNEAIMEMVQAQRENKVAMLGLQVSLTSALLPAIHAGDEELQTFIKTLNDPNLTSEQKFARISKQFEGIEDTLVQVIDRAAPQIAEHAGELGIQLAGAVWKGFWGSDAIGKLAIGTWLFRAMGGIDLIRATGGRAGGAAGMGFGTKFIAGATGLLIGWEVGRILEEKTKGGFHRWAVNAAEDFVNTYVQNLNDGMDKANVFAFLGVDAPNIGEVNLHDTAEEVAEGKHITHHALPHGQIPPGSEGPGITTPAPGGHRRRHRSSPQKRPQTTGIQRRANWAGSDRPIVIHHQTILDSKVVAESTAHAVAGREALA